MYQFVLFTQNGPEGPVPPRGRAGKRWVRPVPPVAKSGQSTSFYSS